MKNPYTTAIACTWALALTLLTSAASAATLEYRFTGVGSGSLAGSAFEPTSFVIVGHADPLAIASCLNDCRYLDFSSATVSIDGVGNFALLSPTRVFNNHGNLGLSRGGAEGLDLYSAFTVPVGYDFASAIGPLTRLVALLQWQKSAAQGADDVLTSGGTLVFNDGDTQGSFEARVAGVPLPAASWLFGSALLGGTLTRRRRPR